jgi:hypothetical protein
MAKSKKKMCPLLTENGNIQYCREELCAWWIVPPQAIKDPSGHCAIFQIAEELRLKQL